MAEGRRKARRKITPQRVSDRLSKVETEMESILADVAEGATTAEQLDPVQRHQLEKVIGGFTERMQQRLESIEPTSDEQIVASAMELLSPTQIIRILGNLRMRFRSKVVDDFGADPKVEEQIAPLIRFLFETYFRVESEGVGNIPERGRCLLVANRSGFLPWDSLMIKEAVEREHPSRRRVRWLVEDFVYNQPFLGPVVAQLGGVRACQEHAYRLLDLEQLVCVFPEGIIGATKLYKDRYRLGRFGRGGYIKLVLRTDTPIIPVAVIGAEESHPVIARFGAGSKKVLGGSYFPVTPTFPALGPLGLIPVPTKWLVVFGEPIHFGTDAEKAEDEVLVRRLNEQIRTNIQAMLTEALRRRKSVLFG